jgi:hypothetical protein
MRSNMAETRLDRVRAILDAAASGNPSHGGTGRFWELDYDAFIGAVVYGQKVIIPGDPDGSALIKALKGVEPFNGPDSFNTRPPFARMPLGGPYVSDSDIQFIADWIKDGCPQH